MDTSSSRSSSPIYGVVDYAELEERRLSIENIARDLIEEVDEMVARAHLTASPPRDEEAEADDNTAPMFNIADDLALSSDSENGSSSDDENRIYLARDMDHNEYVLPSISSLSPLGSENPDIQRVSDAITIPSARHSPPQSPASSLSPTASAYSSSSDYSFELESMDEYEMAAMQEVVEEEEEEVVEIDEEEGVIEQMEDSGENSVVIINEIEEVAEVNNRDESIEYIVIEQQEEIGEPHIKRRKTETKITEKLSSIEVRAYRLRENLERVNSEVMEPAPSGSGIQSESSEERSLKETKKAIIRKLAYERETRTK